MIWYGDSCSNDNGNGDRDGDGGRIHYMKNMNEKTTSSSFILSLMHHCRKRGEAPSLSYYYSSDCNCDWAAEEDDNIAKPTLILLTQ